MLLWIGFGVLTAGVVAALIAPLRRGAEPPAAGASHDSAIYRDQLQEIEAEQRRGLFTTEEASAARAEVARRLIKSAEASKPFAASPEASETGRAYDRLLYAVAIAIPLLSVAVYLAIGSPQIPGQPLAARQGAPGEASVAELIARVEARLRAEPEDGKGWDVIAPVYLRLGRYGDAVHAYSQANRILGDDVRRLVGFGEASLLKSNGVVGEDVRRAAERILALEPGRPEAAIWLALAKEQDGDLAAAAERYRDILKSAPADAPWRNAVSDQIAALEAKIAGRPVPAPQAETGGSPSAEAMARMEEMSPEERAKTIDSMVAGLAERLKRDGKDLGGWLKLVRAYKVLGRDEDAMSALGEARRTFEGDRESLTALDELAKSLGLGS
jgi:cytochrome c-type biogenesis protein CcmH